MTKTIELRKLGTQGLVVPALGLGCMGMTAFYQDTSTNEERDRMSLATIDKSLELGMNFLDTAWVYQSFGVNGRDTSNEELIAHAIAKHGRDKFIIATKFGFLPTFKISGKPEDIETQLSDSLRRLGTTYIDLYYMHRMDPETPIEITMAYLKAQVEAGRIKYIGLSECTPEELRRAHVVHPISAIQMEWSLTTRDIEDHIVPVARELGVGIVPYSPLGRGLLAATFKSLDELAPNDWRRQTPRFQGDTFEQNLPTKFFDIAKRKGCTPAQLALAWVLSRGSDVVPIPGTKSVDRLEENFGALAVTLSESELVEIEASIPVIQGDRYPDMQSTFNTRL